MAWATTEPVGSSNPTKPFPQRIIRTTDAGQRWQDVTPPGLALATGDRYISGADFLDVDHAWVVHGGVVDGSPQFLVSTSDGGHHWSTLGRLPSPYCGAQFVDPTDGWCVASFAASGADQVIVYQTTDGGRRWALVSKSASLTGAPGSPGSLPLICDKQVKFLTPSQGWAGFDCNLLSPLYETTDGGHNWVGRFEKVPPSDYDPSRSPTGWVALPTMTGAEGAAGLSIEDPKPVSIVYRTSDGGASWQPVPSPGKPRNWSIDLVDATHWKLVSGRTILATDNAGRTWQTINSDIAIRSGSEAPDFVTPQIGWYPGGDAEKEFRTTDGGRIWWSVRIPDLGI